MKSLLLFLIVLTWLTISSQAVRACQCLEYGLPVCAAYWRSDAVFVGQLKDITPRDLKSEDSPPIATLHFIVEQPFRGITTAEVDVGTLSGTSCDVEFVKGRRYLIYAHRESESNQLFAGACSRTTELRYATDDLNYIRSLKQQGVIESIAGRVARNKYDPMQGVKIEVRNGDKTLETTTDEEGNYSVSLSGPGSYTVKVLVQSSVGVMATREDLISKLETTDNLTSIEYRVELGKSQCDYREFDLFPVDLHATAEFSGSVLTASGQPVDKGHVNLLKSREDTNRWRSTKIEADGSFKFEGLPAGEYFLVLNPDNRAPDENDPPYPRTFYPNAPDESGATKIAVTEGGKLEDLILRVGPPWKAKTVSGTVVWRKGGAVRNAQVSLYDATRYIRRIDVDENGRFSFKVYGNFDYAVEAQVWGARQGKSKRITLSDNSTNLTLVLDPE